MTFTKIHAAVLTALASKKGAAMAEYALLIALIAVVATVAVTSLGTAISSKFSGLVTSL